MLTFRIAITAAVMAFITALTACLILIQIATFHAAARAAASAAMDAASANTLNRLEAQESELSAIIRVLSTNPSLADSDDRSEVDGAIVVFKAALHELPQTDSLYVGYDNGCWLQVRRLDVLDPTERRKLGAPAGAVYNVNLVRPTSGGALPMRRIFEDGEGNKIGQLDLPDYGYDARKRVWYRDTMQTDGALVSSPYASFSIGTPMITLSAPLQGRVRGVIATDLKLDKFSDWVYAQRPGEHGNAIIFDSFGAGFLVHANGMRMLRSLGLAAGVENAGTVVRRWCFCDEHGDFLSETDLEALWGSAGPCVGIERPKLQRALLPGVFNVRCRLGTSVTSLAQDGHRVSVRFSDGSTGDYDLVVGADGIGSTVRALALTTAAPSELGAMNWRSIAPIRPAGLTGLQMHLGDGCTFGLVPMGGGRTYGFAYVVQSRFRDPLEGRLDRLRDRFAKFGSRVQEYLSSLERDDQVICSAMEWLEIEQWHIGRVVLVGDAAHASSPMMGQGGCMAMEDACVLAEELHASTTVERALAKYVNRRKPRVEWVQRQSMAVGDILTVPSAVRNPRMREAGNQMMQARFNPLVQAP